MRVTDLYSHVVSFMADGWMERRRMEDRRSSTFGAVKGWPLLLITMGETFTGLPIGNTLSSLLDIRTNIIKDHINHNNQFIKRSTSSFGRNHQVSSRHIES